ncbi:hypothetical protein ABT288_10085 [Streptomyces sp. NPDC001093]|uniref:hypothetical protein n=1 Tax=Streptomyces sp. NPDC001093 TaxID=3154376 RepID=UPI00331D6790
MEGEVLGDLDVVGIQGVTPRVAEGGALEVELTGDGGAGHAEPALDVQVPAQHVATGAQMDGGYRLGVRRLDHCLSQVDITVDLGPGEQQRAVQAAP